MKHDEYNLSSVKDVKILDNLILFHAGHEKHVVRGNVSYQFFG